MSSYFCFNLSLFLLDTDHIGNWKYLGEIALKSQDSQVLGKNVLCRYIRNNIYKVNSPSEIIFYSHK